VIFHVARDGEVIGEFDEEDFREKLGRKEILWTDHFLAEASQEWKPVHDYNPGRKLPAKTPPIRRANKPPPIPRAMIQNSEKTSLPRAAKVPLSPAQTGTLFAVCAALIPLLWAPLFIFISLPLLLAAFVLAIMAIVKGKLTSGVLLLIGLVFAFGMGFTAMIDPEKISIISRPTQIHGDRRS
jgi:hypothetical protein